VKTAGNIGEVDVRHHRRIVADAIQAKAFTHVAIDGQAHLRCRSAAIIEFSSVELGIPVQTSVYHIDFM
jgi:hypothetical protein